MSEERQRVLHMLKSGRITVEEAEALLEALEEEREESTAGEGQQPVAASARGAAPPETTAGPTPGVGAGAAGSASGAPAGAPSAETPAGRPRDFHQVIEDIVSSVDVDSIMATVQESLKRSRVDVDRIKDDVRRAAHRAREESRRAAREYRRHQFDRHGFGVSISRAIEGLWGLSDASGTWSCEAGLRAGQSLSINNIWGDVKLEPSVDGRLHVQAITRAWGRDQAEAQGHLDQIRIAAADEGAAYRVRVEPPAGGFPRRFRVDFEMRVPAGVPVDLAHARGDVEAHGLGGTLAMSVASGDAAVRDHNGDVHVESARGDVTLERIAGAVRISSRHGDVALTDIKGRAEVGLLSGDITVIRAGSDLDLSTLHGDVEARGAAGRILAHTKSGDVKVSEPAGPAVLNLETASGDIDVQIEQLTVASLSTVSTVSGDVAVRLGGGVRCRVTARVTSGDISTSGPLVDTQKNRRSLQGVLGGPDATLDLSTVSGDISINAERVDAGIRG